jgi:23S rRNA pseudouridine2605 synthase
MTKKPFQKFIQKKETGAKKKETIRQEKKQARKEKNEYFENKKRERFQGTGSTPTGRGYSAGASGKPGFAKKQDAGSQQAPTNNKQPLRVNKSSSSKPVDTKNTKPETGVPMPLNKFIAHSGICSRRDAAELVKKGLVTVNGKQTVEPGFKVTGKDEVHVNGKKVTILRNLVYILLNKPKDYITTTEDPEGRKTVFDIIKHATTERVYPIGRLDRNTTGILLFTNDGELTQKLSHPSYEVKKIYEVKLDKPLVKKDFDTLINGITLEDGFIAPDVLAYADPKDKSVIGIEIHSGRNRIVRRIFENLGYDVRNLDRVMYANLTKKNVDRGKWRFLSEKEVRLLKYMNASYKKNKPVARG